MAYRARTDRARRSVVSVRLDDAMHAQLQDAASRQGETVSGFIEAAVRLRIDVLAATGRL